MKRVTTAGYIENINKLKNSINGNARYSFTINGNRYYTATDSDYTDVVKNSKPGDYVAIVAPRGKTISEISVIEENNPNKILSAYISSRFTVKSLKYFLEDIRELMKKHGIEKEIPYAAERNNYTCVDLYAGYNLECCMTNLECGTPRECAERVIRHYYQMINNRD